jgi:fibronectin type 3 domain-containing protein
VSYKIYRGGWGTETFLTSTTATSFTDTGAGAWTWHYYRVTAVNAAGLEGAYTPDVGGYKTC